MTPRQMIVQNILIDFQQELNANVGKAINSRRLFHGRGQTYSGLEFVCIDFFQPIILVTLFAKPPKGWLNELQEWALSLVPSLINAVVVQHRYKEGAPADVLLGNLTLPLYAQRDELRFLLTPGTRQNIGFFLDMEPGRHWLEVHCKGRRVLNLFAYTCAFSVVAIAAGAQCVVNVDMSKGALSEGRKNHQLNNLDKNKSVFLPEQILKSWSRIRKQGPYDIVLFDPPSYQRGSFVAEKDYGKLIRRIPELMPNGGNILACLNAPELDDDFLQSQFSSHCPGARLVERLASSPDFPDVDSKRQLKLMHYFYEVERIKPA